MRRPGPATPGRRTVQLALLSTALSLSLTGPAPAHEGHEGGGEVMVVAAVVPGGPAAEAGLAEGDRILRFDGLELSTQYGLDGFLATHQPGETVRLLVERDGEQLEIPLTLGERPQGGVSMGVSLGVEAAGGAATSRSEGLGRAECLAWVDETYRVAALANDLDLDLAADLQMNRACMERDTALMAVPIPVTWCDNIFKIHCSGLDLLAEVGDAQVERCADLLSDSLGADVRRDPAWTTCGEQKVFERYSIGGESSDEAACRQVLLDECGAKIGGGP